MSRQKDFHAPMVEWSTLWQTYDLDEARRREADAALVAVRAARFSAYLGRRMSGGKHVDAVKRQNQVARKVRQALGYTYADDRITF